ncbi:DUF2461 domain-containing protein [Hymenobacter busanensis]|uniref:DUF2461 domain-containing protein n=1 Tax=Hymenobacter busanensis TaxID=2607656 RepID=UPI00136688D9|nr:DUF2461 domain-containing protein [Hymenobacter busanensis]QHJ07248.1 TIGR02453 family protein [Hymenobacter busanensis]
MNDLAFALDFLRQLHANNSKPWMDAHRADYHRARGAFAGLVTQLLKRAQAFEPDLAPLSPAETMYRINKNDRFQQSDEPYKRHMAAGFKRGGRQSPWAGYFVALEPGGETYVGAGRWQPEPAQLARIRQEIHYSADAFHAMRQNAELLRHFPAGLDQSNALKTAPKGYDRDDPDIEWLRLKSFFVWRSIPDADVLRPDFADRVVAAWQAAQPLVHFLNHAVEGE